MGDIFESSPLVTIPSPMLEIAGLTIVGFFLLLPVFWAWRFTSMFARRHQANSATTDFPRAGVVLCLRGTDPSLENCLSGLLAQDYPNHELWIVIDSEEDPARRAVAAVLERFSNPGVPIHVSVLKQRLSTCSLKLSAQRQAIGEMREGCEVVAFIDADVIPAPDWLRSLVQPLAEKQTGCSTGIRWYTPQGKSWGTLVRYLWNAAADTQMMAFGIPWGGSLAFRIDVIDRAGLLEQWSQSVAEDTSTACRLDKLGLKVRYVPHLLMINPETTDLKSCLVFIRRQLVVARLNHPNWHWLVIANLAHAAALAAAIVIFILACAWEQWSLAAWTAGLFLVFALGLVSALIWGETQMRRLAQARGMELPYFLTSWRAWLALPLAQVLHVGCLVSALLARRIGWRGITYELEGQGKVRMAEYRPYAVEKEQSGASRSVV